MGTGIRAGIQLTPEAGAAFEQASAAFYLVVDAIAAKMLEELNPSARSLYGHYVAGVDRRVAYDGMTEALLVEVRAGHSVCAAFYGHPGIFVAPSHDAIRRARAEGFAAQMLPAISAEDCLFADLGVDPGVSGCQSYGATDFLLRRRRIDPTAALIIWQVSVIGIRRYESEPTPQNLDALVGYLLQWYAPDHPVTLYEASPYPFVEPSIRELTLEELSHDRPSPLATLYVPPTETRIEDSEMAARLGIQL